MEFENIILEKKGHVGILTINHPPANAVNLATLLDMQNALNDLESDKNIRAIIFTGAGEKGFSAGFDVSDAANGDKCSYIGTGLWTRIDRLTKPTIAAINGFALGGGCELAMACHFRIMVDAPKALIGLPELNLGIIPAWGGTQRMTRMLGRAKALDIILFSKRLTAPEALAIGLVDKVSAPGEVLKDALEMANLLAERPPLAVSVVLKSVSDGLEYGTDAGLRAEFEGVTRVIGTSKDAMEGFAAFLEKRKPNFKGE
ncbi:MAG: enoyl-CoA hydratase/isomerase family protein [Deltaproteobacteria bacterium]|nr:enoyl-CoA hydratase/isomerase family protein [Deltaproteobacteria bacterium]